MKNALKLIALSVALFVAGSTIACDNSANGNANVTKTPTATATMTATPSPIVSATASPNLTATDKAAKR